MATTLPSIVRVAVTQAEPGWFDLSLSVQKTINLIREASVGGAQLVSFPECWIPGYPCWIWKYPVRPDLYARYHKNSLRVDSPEMRAILDAAKEAKIVVVLGYSERGAEGESESLYMGQSIISAEGELMLARRKMKPTHMERTVFGDASGGDKTVRNVVQTPLGKVGGLVCWEHLQPLLKYHTISQGVQIHVAGWPPITTIEDPARELYSMSKEGCQTISRVFAMESQSFVLHTGTVIGAAGVAANETEGAVIMSKPSGGSSTVFAPDGRLLTKEQELRGDEEGIVYCDLPTDMIYMNKGMVDPMGHYSRPDIFTLVVDTGERRHVSRK